MPTQIVNRILFLKKWCLQDFNRLLMYKINYLSLLGQFLSVKVINAIPHTSKKRLDTKRN